MLPFISIDDQQPKDNSEFAQKRLAAASEVKNQLLSTTVGSSNSKRANTGANAIVNIAGTVASSAAFQSAVLTDNGSLVAPADRLTNFHRRLNKVLLDNIAIAKEKERLQVENAQLEDLIKQYVSGTKLSDDVLKDDNPLFVVNGR